MEGNGGVWCATVTQCDAHPSRVTRNVCTRARTAKGYSTSGRGSGRKTRRNVRSGAGKGGAVATVASVGAGSELRTADTTINSKPGNDPTSTYTATGQARERVGLDRDGGRARQPRSRHLLAVCGGVRARSGCAALGRGMRGAVQRVTHAGRARMDGWDDE